MFQVQHNPIAVAPPGYNASEFRDPTTAWQGPDRIWRILVGANTGTRGIVGAALIFKSKDFRHWKFVDRPLHSVVGTGMWECPDFYPVPVEGDGACLKMPLQGSTLKHVLKISSDDKKHDYYSVGIYDVETDTYAPASAMLDTGIGLRYDYGKFYASKSFFDQHTSRRILLGWSNESDSIQDDINKGWSSIQAIYKSLLSSNFTTAPFVT